MNRQLRTILAVILVSAFGIIAVSEAQTMKDDGLNLKQQKIVPIAAFTANGDLQRLKAALSEGLDAGMTINEIKEILVQLYAYAGFPRSLNGIATFMNVLEEREKKGVKDQVGKEASPMPAGKSSIELGTEIQTRLVGRPVTGPIYAFAPVIDQFLKGHLFGDIFGRDILDLQSREIATISALASIEGVNPQLESHFNVGLNTGLTEAQMRSLVSLVETSVGKKEGHNADEVLGKVLSSRRAEPVPGPASQGKPSSASGIRPVAGSEVSQTISITRSGSQPSAKGPAEYFTGSVRVDPLFKANDPLRASGAYVTFDPGARSAWHSHPFGQILIVTTGSGRVQKWDGQIEDMRQGDVVRIPPGVKHWHGAGPTTGVTHIAIQEQLDGKSADWMEKVADEQCSGKGGDQQ